VNILLIFFSHDIYFRRLKKDVKDDLPPKLREIVWLDGQAIAPKIADLRKAKQACEKAFSSRVSVVLCVKAH
jgi:hypothetical protein